jgi:hypothetical protein
MSHSLKMPGNDEIRRQLSFGIGTHQVAADMEFRVTHKAPAPTHMAQDLAGIACFQPLAEKRKPA